MLLSISYERINILRKILDSLERIFEISIHIKKLRFIEKWK